MDIVIGSNLIILLVGLFSVFCACWAVIIWPRKEHKNYKKYREIVIKIVVIFCALIIILSMFLIGYDKHRGTVIMPDDLKQRVSFVVLALKDMGLEENSKRYLIIMSEGKRGVRLLDANKNKTLLSLKADETFRRTSEGIEKISP